MYVRASIVLSETPADELDRFREELARRGADGVMAVAEDDGTTRVACRVWLSSILDPYAAAYDAVTEAVGAAGLTDARVTIG
jgi:hypothetical protein